MTTEPDKAPAAEPAAEPSAEPSAPAAAPAAAAPAAPARRRPSGKFVLALTGAFLAGAVCTGCVGLAAAFVVGHGHDHRGFDDDHPKIERMFPDRGPWKGGEGWPGDERTRDKSNWPGLPDKGVWPLPDGKPGLPAVPAPEQKPAAPVPSATS
ncbi:hypothetical protein [Catellatospora citrea]|uniref:Uncharacterized protein n=1 Tax=Catellatospora citrea TaxID=53366 RepID=A0A8J3KN14_9ACTN|nr:hypothetical protein [Catellatospora citrea]GIF98884.1 hypothetical protein Cci01nite_39780 [Catellatospora citrea]